MLGISVYFQDYDEDYLRKCAEIGAKYVFTSLHIPEEDYSDLDIKLPAFLSLCQELDLTICPDVSPVTFEKLHLTFGDFETLKQLGFKALRLDYGFDDVAHIQSLIQDFEIFLNASVVSETFIKDLNEAKVDFNRITFTHNFYPKRFTGLSLDTFKEKQAIFKKYHLRTQAFVCGDVLKRFPLYEGLPTLEIHRDTHPLVASLELISLGVTDIMIGDSKASKATLKAIQTFMRENILEIKVHLDHKYAMYYDQIFECRKDQSEVSLRLNTPRTKGNVPYQNGKRRKGDITLDNDLMGRYSGELQLLKKDLPSDARVNCIGFIHPQYIDALDFIPIDTKIKLVKF